MKDSSLFAAHRPGDIDIIRPDPFQIHPVRQEYVVPRFGRLSVPVWVRKSGCRSGHGDREIIDLPSPKKDAERIESSSDAFRVDEVMAFRPFLA